MTVKVNPGIYKLLVRTRNTNAANEKFIQTGKSKNIYYSAKD